MGSAVAAFVAANGPSAIVAYNWNKVKGTKIDSVFVERVAVVLSAASDYAKHDLADTLRLTPLGQRELPRKPAFVVYTLELACGGGGNCETTCCKGRGKCTLACESKKRHRACAARIKITCTLQDVVHRRVRLQLLHQHVPAGEALEPPPPKELRPFPALKRELARQANGVEASDAVSTYVQQTLASSTHVVGALGGASTSTATATLYSGRFAPTAAQVARAASSTRCDQRGDPSLDDWEKLNRAVAEQFVQRGLVLEFEPLGPDCGYVVLSNEWALNLASKYGRNIAGTDAKHDTTIDCRSYWSSIRFPTPFGWYPACAWISPDETGERLLCAFKAYYLNVPCGRSDCDHSIVEEWTASGGYRRRLKCVAQGWDCTQAPPWASPPRQARADVQRGAAGGLRPLISRWVARLQRI